jgi:hypothetical protein
MLMSVCPSRKQAPSHFKKGENGRVRNPYPKSASPCRISLNPLLTYFILRVSFFLPTLFLLPSFYFTSLLRHGLYMKIEPWEGKSQNNITKYNIRHSLLTLRELNSLLASRQHVKPSHQPLIVSSDSSTACTEAKPTIPDQS